MEKIIELICKEAQRRPGKRLQPKLLMVTLEVVGKILHLCELMAAIEEQKELCKPLGGYDLNEWRIK